VEVFSAIFKNKRGNKTRTRRQIGGESTLRLMKLKLQDPLHVGNHPKVFREAIVVCLLGNLYL
jgi:hypothetical protein